MSGNIRLQIGNAIAFSFFAIDPFQERDRIVPSGAHFPQIILVQFLQGARLAMAVELLTDLEPKQFKRASGRARARTMGADDNDRRRMSIFHSARLGRVTEPGVQMFERIGGKRLVLH